MSFDPRSFNSLVITDTCAIWNTLSSRRLFNCACSAKVTFFMTPMVRYECLHKPRKTITKEKQELIDRLEHACRAGRFVSSECELSDLLAVMAIAPKGLGSGELSCIANAYKIRTVAVMTDERKARNFAESKLGLRVETTPKMYGWLHYYMHLNDSDHMVVIQEHILYEKNKPLTKYFEEAYTIALQYRIGFQPAARGASEGSL